MSQAQDMVALNDLFQRSTPANPGAQAIKDTWNQWYGMLDSISRDYDPENLADAKARRDAFNRTQALGAVSAPGPIAIVPIGPKPTIKQGSTGSAAIIATIKDWQRVVGALPVDGIFGSKTNSLTKTWQKAHGLVADGIVGPLSWAQAQANSNAVMAAPLSPVQAAQQAVQAVLTMPPIVVTSPGVATIPGVITTPKLTNPAIVTAAPSSTLSQAAKVAASVSSQAPMNQSVPKAVVNAASANARPVLKTGSNGAAVKEWQGLIGITPADGAFGPQTDQTTRTFQTLNGLPADGIVGPMTWAAGLARPATGFANVGGVDVSAAVGVAVDTVKAAALNIHNSTPLWLKVTTGALAGLSALLGIGFLAGSKKRTT
jgi:peptidoglycan hydrolase-like protein with peptidoglycan-binding domain